MCREECRVWLVGKRDGAQGIPLPVPECGGDFAPPSGPGDWRSLLGHICGAQGSGSGGTRRAVLSAALPSHNHSSLPSALRTQPARLNA